MKTLSVVVPIYYGENLIAPFGDAMDTVEQSLERLGVRLQLIFVDDGSPDMTMIELLEYKRRRPATLVVKLTRNFGAINASKTGLKFVTGDCFTIMAVDLQDPPELLVEMVKRWQEGAKYVLCERTKRADPPATRFFSAVYYKLVRTFLMKDFPKGGVDFVFWDASILPYVRDAGKHVNRVLLAHWLGHKPETIYYERPARHSGTSRWTFSKKINLFVDSFVGFSVLPVRAISFMGFAISLGSIAYSFVILTGSLMGRITVPGFATPVILISFLLGVVMVMLGIVGEYVWRIFELLNQRPEAVIDEVYDDKVHEQKVMRSNLR